MHVQMSFCCRLNVTPLRRSLAMATVCFATNRKNELFKGEMSERTNNDFPCKKLTRFYINSPPVEASILKNPEYYWQMWEEKSRYCGECFPDLLSVGQDAIILQSATIVNGENTLPVLFNQFNL